MTVRFRIRTSQGQELSFASSAMFEEFVRSGELAPDDLVYDAETGEWAPSRTHPLVLEIDSDDPSDEVAPDRGEAVASDSDASGARPPDAAAGSATLGAERGAAAAQPEAAEPHDADPGRPPEPVGGDDFGLELAPPAEEPTPEEAARAFVEQLESERARETELGAGGASVGGLRPDDGSVLSGLVTSVPEPLPRAPRRPPREQGADRPQRSGPPPRARRPAAGRSRLRLLLLLLALVAAAYLYVSYGPGAASDGDLPELESDSRPGATRMAASAVAAAAARALRGASSGSDAPTAAEPPPAPEIPPTEDAVRVRALERFMADGRDLVGVLPPVPDVWLGGEYLASPSAHGEVRDAWEAHLDVARSLSAAVEVQYLDAYRGALDDAAVDDESVRSVRAQAAALDFSPTAARVRAHWVRVEELAVAALRGHDALIEAEGTILYDASGAIGPASGLGAGTSGRDSDAQLLLDELIELMERVLTADGLGPRAPPNVRDWVWGGFVDVVTH